MDRAGSHLLDMLCVLTYAFCACAACAQVVEEGYEFFAKRQLVTIFSAPNYCGEFENAGAMMSVDETLMCSFQVSKTFTQRAAQPALCILIAAARRDALQEGGTCSCDNEHRVRWRVYRHAVGLTDGLC